MKETEAKTIRRVRVEVADLVIVIVAEWWWGNTDEEDRDLPARIRHFVGTQGVLDTRGPAIKALMARRDALLGRDPAL